MLNNSNIKFNYIYLFTRITISDSSCGILFTNVL